MSTSLERLDESTSWTADEALIENGYLFSREFTRQELSRGWLERTEATQNYASTILHGALGVRLQGDKLEFGVDVLVKGPQVIINARVVHIVKSTIWAKQSLRIHTKELVIDGAFIARAPASSIQAERVTLLNLPEGSRWLEGLEGELNIQGVESLCFWKTPYPCSSRHPTSMSRVLLQMIISGERQISFGAECGMRVEEEIRIELEGDVDIPLENFIYIGKKIVISTEGELKVGKNAWLIADEIHLECDSLDVIDDAGGNKRASIWAADQLSIKTCLMKVDGGIIPRPRSSDIQCDRIELEHAEESNWLLLPVVDSALEAVQSAST